MIVQGSQEWLQSRVGVVTASRFADVMATIKSGEAAARYNYKAEIVAERLTGAPAPNFVSAPMQWGTDHEPEARKIYEAIKGVTVEETGLVKHDTLPVGASTDGLVDEDGCIEIKCPNTATHIQTLLSGKAPKQYMAQMQGSMWLNNRQYCDFVSYDPRLNDRLAIFIIRVPRDDAYIQDLEQRLGEFVDEVDVLVKELEAL